MTTATENVKASEVSAPVDGKADKKPRGKPKHYGFTPQDYVLANRNASNWGEMIAALTDIAKKRGKLSDGESINEDTIYQTQRKIAAMGVKMNDWRPAEKEKQPSFMDLIDVAALNADETAMLVDEDNLLVVKHREKKFDDAEKTDGKTTTDATNSSDTAAA